MCGIVGLFDSALRNPEDVVQRMCETIRHRGPDGGGVYHDGPMTLGMRRLAIIDIPGGTQPMVSKSGCAIVFNGEIYNHDDIRRQLEKSGVEFLTRSDTEVVLRAFEAWGPRAPAQFEGMWAAVFWDAKAQRVLLSRDRFGKKPLYLWNRGAGFAFASEPKAFAVIDRLPELDPGALAQYIHLGYVPDDTSIWRNVEKVRPGTTLVCNLNGGRSDEIYYRPPPASSGTKGSPHQLESHLRRSVARRLVSDVEVGVLLSGGIDSSLTAWFASELNPGVQTFSVAFDDPTVDESRHARAVAAELGTRHHERRVGELDALEAVPRLSTVYDEPFADPSALPTLLICEYASSHVKVALGGDGGDELFGGYTRYRSFERYERLRRVAPVQVSERVTRYAGFGSSPLRRLANVADTLGASPGETYRNVVAVTSPAVTRRLVPGAPRSALDLSRFHWPTTESRHHLPGLTDLNTYLRGDLLVKVDRASMSASLEVRSPFLDTDLVAWAYSLDADSVGPPGAKLLPRALLRRRFGTLADRPKQGFGVPLAAWLRGPLRKYMLDATAPGEIAKHGMLDAPAVLEVREALLKGRDIAAATLWTVTMFQTWHQQWRQGGGAGRCS